MNISPTLLRACINKNRKAQLQLYRSCFSILMGVCRRYMKHEEDAMALLNLGFLKILNKLDTYKTHIPFEAWIRRVMINTIIDEYRKNKRYNEKTDKVDFGSSYTKFEGMVVYNEAEDMLGVEEIERMVQQLPSAAQRVFNLYVIDGYTHKEIGEMLGISVGTSKWHLSDARKRLRKMIERVMAQRATLQQK